MGVGPRISSSASESPFVAPVAAPNPDPARFFVVREKTFGGWCVAVVEYPGCTTFEGRKVLVLPVPTVRHAVLSNGGLLDPHFSNTFGWISPIARFPATALGETMAIRLCREFQGG